MPVTFLLPTSAPIELRTYDLTLDVAARPLRLGLLANGFPESDRYLRKQAEAIAELVPGTTFHAAVKGTTDQLSACVGESILSEMVADVDGVIIGWGHCGSCTSGVARDAIAFADRGIPSVTLICDIFWDYSTWIGEALGMTDLPRVQLPYPVSGTGDTNQRSVAAKAAPDIIAAFAGNAS